MKKNSHVQMTDTVTRQFEEQVDMYSQHEVDVDSQILPFLKQKLGSFKRNQATITVCEFGGGGGDLLNSLEKQTKRKLTMINAELVGEYAKHQATKRIKFVRKSILDSRYKDNSFDIVMVRNVIHHLVHTSLPKTRENQQFAIKELVRVTRPGGLILIDEQVNNSAISCSLFFGLSWLATKLKLNIPAFEITPNTVVGYLTRLELQNLCKNALGKKNWVANSFVRWPPSLQWKLTGLMEETGSAFIGMQKPK